MGLGRWWFCDWYTAGELDRIDDHLAHERRRGMSERSKVGKYVDDVERSLASVALVARALGELCLKKGLFTQAEMETALREVDLADGILDDRLDPKLAKIGSVKPKVAPPLPPKKKRPIPRSRRRF